MNALNYKLKICKFFLKNKCKNGNKCSFQHLHLFEIEKLISQLKDAQSENHFLRKKLNENNHQVKNYNVIDTTASETRRKPLYNSFFAFNDQADISKVIKIILKRMKQLKKQRSIN